MILNRFVHSERLELSTSRFVGECSIQLSYECIVAIEGIEPTSHGYEPSVITIIRYRHFAHPLGFEPRTYRLTADCSTAEL